MTIYLLKKANSRNSDVKVNLKWYIWRIIAFSESDKKRYNTYFKIRFFTILVVTNRLRKMQKQMEQTKCGFCYFLEMKRKYIGSKAPDEHVVASWNSCVTIKGKRKGLSVEFMYISTIIYTLNPYIKKVFTA